MQPQSPPKPLMRRAPGTQFGVGISARINVGKRGGFGISRDGQFQGKVTGLIPVGSMIETAGQPPAVDAQQIEESDLFLLRGKPGVCFRSQRLRLARLMGEFSDGFLDGSCCHVHALLAAQLVDDKRGRKLLSWPFLTSFLKSRLPNTSPALMLRDKVTLHPCHQKRRLRLRFQALRKSLNATRAGSSFFLRNEDLALQRLNHSLIDTLSPVTPDHPIAT